VAKPSDLRMLFGALVGVGLGGVALLTVVPVMAPPKTSPRPVAPEAAPAADLALDAGLATADLGAAPRFDTVRIAPDGSGLVAGQAEPGAQVAVLAGGEVAAEATADGDGRFVAFLELAPSAEPRALSLRDGSGGLSEETVIVAPTGETSIRDGSAVADAGPSGDGGPVAPAREGRAGQGVAAGPEVATTTRDLPMDQPVPDLASAGEPVAGLPGIGAEDASSSAAAAAAANGVLPAPTGTAGAAADGVVAESAQVAIAGAPTDVGASAPASGAAPTVVATGPAGGQAPGGAVGTTVEPASGGTAPSSVAIAVAGPAASPADAPPEHAGAPAVDVSPDILPEADGEAGQAAVLLSDAEGVRLLQPALAPGADAEVLSTVALDAIAYGDAGQVLLSGRASGGGAVRVYLDNRPVGDASVGADGQWSAEISGTDAGTYTLRVDQLDLQGQVTSRIETPFLREAEGDLADLVGQAQRAGQTIAMRTVQPGNTLWAIARDRYGEPLMYVQVFEMNRDRIRDPDLIYPGQVFVMPATAGR